MFQDCSSRRLILLVILFLALQGMSACAQEQVMLLEKTQEVEQLVGIVSTARSAVTVHNMESQRIRDSEMAADKIAIHQREADDEWKKSLENCVTRFLDFSSENQASGLADDALLAAAQCREQLGDYAAALSIYTNVKSSYGNAVRSGHVEDVEFNAWAILGCVIIQQGTDEEWKRIVETQNARANVLKSAHFALLGMARCYKDLGNEEEFIKCCWQIIEDSEPEPPSSPPTIRLGDISVDGGPPYVRTEYPSPTCYRRRPIEDAFLMLLRHSLEKKDWNAIAEIGQRFEQKNCSDAESKKIIALAQEELLPK